MDEVSYGRGNGRGHGSAYGAERDAAYDLITMGRIGVDLYPLQTGVSLAKVTSFGKFLGGSPSNVAGAAAPRRPPRGRPRRPGSAAAPPSSRAPGVTPSVSISVRNWVSSGSTRAGPPPW